MHIRLVVVDQESKFVMRLRYRQNRLAAVLMLFEKTLIKRTDTEPSMLLLREKLKSVQKYRLK